jgi:acyl-CoA synthetase (AMP-forming)/AMP-acid ligase II
MIPMLPPKPSRKTVGSKRETLAYSQESGYLRITDRIKDMFISGGFNCYPAEIENMLLNHPLIADVSIIGTQDARMGEVGHAFVVLQEGATIDKPSLITWSREHMANFKVPKQYTFVTDVTS